VTSHKLVNLVKIGQLKAEPGSQSEFNGLLRSAKARLTDARNETLSIESRFDLAYNASHALALAALRWHGYRSENRYLVFQVLEQTLGIAPEVWRVLAKCHEKRNLAEYEGYLEIDNQLLVDLIKAGMSLLEKASALGTITG
jgi:hypothetical protein